MPSPYRPLPPLESLRVFEAVARNAGFTRAGEELALTQSAVSHRIRQLEEHLGTRLFDRGRAGVALTPAGVTLWEGTRAGLDSMLLATERVRASNRVGVLSVGAPAAFATWWLVPRLGRFAVRAPDIEVRLAIVDGEPDLVRLGLDVAVVSRSPGITASDEMLLLREEIFPVCAPGLAAQLNRPAELAAARLIECDAVGMAEYRWEPWLERFMVSGDKVRWSRFSDLGLAISAAIDGLGVALGRSPMIDAELAAGRLVRLFPVGLAMHASELFALKWREPADQRILAFRDFALDEACGCELAAGPCGMPASTNDLANLRELSSNRAAFRRMTSKDPAQSVGHPQLQTPTSTA